MTAEGLGEGDLAKLRDSLSDLHLTKGEQRKLEEFLIKTLKPMVEGLRREEALKVAIEELESFREELLGDRARRMAKRRCGICMEVVRSGEPRVELKGVRYHLRCFEELSEALRSRSKPSSRPPSP